MVTEVEDLLRVLPGAHRNNRANGVGITCPECGSDKAFASIVAGQVRFGCSGCFQSAKIAAALIDYLKEPEQKLPAPERELERVAYAIAYARYGFRVFPCRHVEGGRCSCRNPNCDKAGKHPLLPGWQASATTDEAEIRAIWYDHPNANIGVACGQLSNLTVLDVDGEEGKATLREFELQHGDLPETPIAMTGRGGLHYYFRFESAVENAVKFAPGLDIRTEGGLVIGVGSTTVGRYEWEAIATLADDFMPAAMPRWLAQKMCEAKSTNGESFKVPDRIPHGQLNHALYRIGRGLAARGHNSDEIFALLAATNKRAERHATERKLHEIADHCFEEKDRPGFERGSFYENGLEEEEDQVRLVEVYEIPELKRVIDEWDRQPWIWDGILGHRSLSLIVGKSETGKSTLIYSLIYAIVTGQEFFGRQCEQGRVVYLAGDPASEIVAGKTFTALGLEDGVTVVAGALVAHPQGLKLLRDIVEKKKPVLVVADTLAATVPIDTDSYGQSYKVQQPLSILARQFGPNLLMSHHSQKSAMDHYNVIDSALGSVGVAAVASARMATKMYKRNKKKFFTFEMSNLRMGQPIEGEWIVHKMDDGRVELVDLWQSRSLEMDRELILALLNKRGELMTKRAIWVDLRPKPKWAAFSEAFEALLDAGQLESVESGKSGGGHLFGPPHFFKQNKQA